ncbi:MAG: NAD(P)-dependent oxidoreductase [Cyanobacteriota bacterium]|nr:NAD(P)-dependent oxidoreductase [Cyanobacteriota bacterium]
MKKLLVTGASGFLGWHLCQVAREEWEVCGTYFSQEIAISGVSLARVDLRETQQLQAYFDRIQPDAVIHAAAQSKPNFCQSHPEESYRTNVTVTAEIAKLCAQAEIPCAFTSTDLVFDGLNPPYRETDPTCPVSIYGQHKVAAETELLSIYPQAVACRMPLMFGAVPPTATTFLQSFLKTLREGGELKLFVDEVRTPVSGTTAARGLLLALTRGQGILHLGGKERISRYEFGRAMAQVMDLPLQLLKPCQQAEVTMAAPRPSDVSLDSSKAIELGYETFCVREELERLKELKI